MDVGDGTSDYPPTIIQPLPTQLSLREGSDIQLECKFAGRPTPSIVWLKDGVQPISAPEFQVCKMIAASSRLKLSRIHHCSIANSFSSLHPTPPQKN